MKDCACVNDELLAYSTLTNDLLFHKIPKEDYLYYINESLKIGKEKAKLYKQFSVEELCKKNEIDISYNKQSGKFYGVQFRAQIELKNDCKKIILYPDSLTEMLNASQKYVEEEITYEDIVRIHLAHELFHFYEYSDKQPTNEKLKPIVRLQLGPLKLHSSVMSTSEIAAHAFAKELLNLNYLPNVYDYILLIYQKELTLESFQKLVEQWNQEIGDYKNVNTSRRTRSYL